MSFPVREERFGDRNEGVYDEWTRVDTPTVMSGLVVRYRKGSIYTKVFEVSASRDAVFIDAEIHREANPGVVLDLIRRALLIHASLKQQIALFGRVAAPSEEALDTMAFGTRLRTDHDTFTCTFAVERSFDSEDAVHGTGGVAVHNVK